MTTTNNIISSVYDPDSEPGTQLNYIKLYETTYHPKTGINYKLDKLLQKEIQISMDSIIDAVCYIRAKHGGRGLRDIAYSMLLTIHQYYPLITMHLLEKFVAYDGKTPSIGSWKDVRNYANFVATYSTKGFADPNIPVILELYNTQLAHDIASFPANMSFAAKYVPRESKNAFFYDILVSSWTKTNTECAQIIKTSSMRFDNKSAFTKCKMLYRKMVSKISTALVTPNTKKRCEPWELVKKAIHGENVDNEWDNLTKKYPLYPDYNVSVLDMCYKYRMHENKARLCKSIANAIIFAQNSLLSKHILVYSHEIDWVDIENCKLSTILERILGPMSINAESCFTCANYIALNGLKQANMTEDEIKQIKVMVFTQSEITKQHIMHLENLLDIKLLSDNFKVVSYY